MKSDNKYLEYKQVSDDLFKEPNITVDHEPDLTRGKTGDWEYIEFWWDGGRGNAMHLAKRHIPGEFSKSRQLLWYNPPEGRKICIFPNQSMTVILDWNALRTECDVHKIVIEDIEDALKRKREGRDYEF